MPGSPDPSAAEAGPAAGRPRSLLEAARERWRRLSSGSVNRQVFGTAVLVASLTLGIKLLSLVKESVVAASFGTGSEYDAFIIALLVPTTITGILSGSLNAALIPTYIEVQEREDDQAAQRLYTTILMWNTVLLVLLALVLAATVHLWLPLIASGFGPRKLLLTRHLIYWSLPMVILTGFSTTWGALLNAGNRFALVALAPSMQTLAVIVFLGLFCRSMGIYALLAGTMAGVVLETALVGSSLARRGHPLLPRWHGVTGAFRKVRSQYGACIGGSFLVSGMGLVDQAFASSAGPRSNSALAYGSKLVSLAITLGASALATAILPQLSRMVAQCDWKGIKRFLKVYAGMILAVTVPGCLLLIALSPLIIRLMYQHGAFTSSDTDLVVKIQVFYLFRIPFAVCGVLVTRTLTALRANQVLLYMSIFSFILNAALDYVLMKSYGIAGITLSTTLCSGVVVLGLGAVMLRLLAKRSQEVSA